jgi:hypothetical protein
LTSAHWLMLQAVVNNRRFLSSSINLLTKQRHFPRFYVVPTKHSELGHEKKVVHQDPQTGQFADTLNLPRTNFSMWFNAVEKEPKLLKNIYEWQMIHNHGSLFVTHDGPPFANGRPHLGHVLNKVLKDIVNRYKVLRGYKVRSKVMFLDGTVTVCLLNSKQWKGTKTRPSFRLLLLRFVNVRINTHFNKLRSKEKNLFGGV